MKNTINYEKTRKILEDNITRYLREKDKSARWLSIKIEKNEWYITRILNGKIDPSLQVISKNCRDTSSVGSGSFFKK